MHGKRLRRCGPAAGDEEKAAAFSARPPLFNANGVVQHSPRLPVPLATWGPRGKPPTPKEVVASVGWVLPADSDLNSHACFLATTPLELAPFGDQLPKVSEDGNLGLCA